MTTADTRSVADVMATDLVTLEVGENLDLAEDIMHVARIRHMPVVEGKRLVGIVSVRDLLAASLSRALDFEPTRRREFLHSVSAEDAMTRAPITVAPDSRLADAAAILLEQKIGCLPVVDAVGNLLGLLTETDLVRVAYLEREEEVVLDGTHRGLEGLGGRLREDLTALKRVRDELQVQLHLGREEARDLWQELDRKFHELERGVATLSRDAQGPMHEVREAAEELVKELQHGYRKLRERISR
ncbi:MAG: CBS domain-containing protein [Deltaproteobacteria bacterium]|nr:CBS domain-containing protein [Deltaproteobacteria bacterium]MBW2360931.1 CBS domain-containing protein [Deltaproteobacteria bacterium]